MIVYKYIFPELLIVDSIVFNYTYIGSTTLTLNERILNGYSAGYMNYFIVSNGYSKNIRGRLHLSDLISRGVRIEILAYNILSKDDMIRIESDLTQEELMFNPACLNRKCGVSNLSKVSRDKISDSVKETNNDLEHKEYFRDTSYQSMRFKYRRWFVNGKGPFFLLTELGTKPYDHWRHHGKPTRFVYKGDLYEFKENYSIGKEDCLESN